MKGIFASVPNVRHQAIDLSLQSSRQRQEWQACGTAIVAVQVHPIFQARNAHLSGHSRSGFCDPLLLEVGQINIAFFPGSVNLVAGRRSRIRKSKDCAYCASLQ